MSPLSTEEVALRVGISRVTLERWLASGKIPAPKKLRFGNRDFRNWTARDMLRVRKYKLENYCKGRGRKPKPKPKR